MPKENRVHYADNLWHSLAGDPPSVSALRGISRRGNRDMSDLLNFGAEDVAPTATPQYATRRELRAAEREQDTRVVPPPIASTMPAPRASDRLSPTLVRSSRSKLDSRKLGLPKKRPRHHLFPKIASIGAMLGVGAFLVASSVPANALMSAADGPASSGSRVQSQSLAAVDTSVLSPSATRDGYTVESLFDLARAANVPTKWLYTNDSNGTIQWPFPVQVPIAQGFGPKTSSCFYCNAFHQGVDFDGGNGSPIGAIADGVVSNVTLGNSGLGNNVTIDHVINGQNVQSLYAHMMAGSVKVTVGETIHVAQEVGQVGATGEATGPHLHLEIHLNGVPIDPFAWLKANAN